MPWKKSSKDRLCYNLSNYLNAIYEATISSQVSTFVEERAIEQMIEWAFLHFLHYIVNKRRVILYIPKKREYF